MAHFSIIGDLRLSIKAAVLVFFLRDSLAVFRTIREIRKISALFAFSYNHHLLRKSDARVYTRLQSARGKGAVALQETRLACAEALYQAVKRLLSDRYAGGALSGKPRACVQGCMLEMSEMLARLEAQACAFSASGAVARALSFSAAASALRERLRKTRLSVLCEDDVEPPRGTVLTLLDDIGEVINAAERLSNRLLRRGRRRAPAA